MTGPSFERIDYQLRYNKHIERKLVFDVLSRAQQLIGIQGHRYLGFGSMWFSDFRLAHRVLGLHEMASMEREKHAARAEFNRPYRSIEVKSGFSTDTLRNFNAKDWSRPLIAWLDYDGCLESYVVKDLEILLSNCASSSVVIVTLNAARGSYRPKVPSTAPRARINTALGQVESLLGGGVVPPRFEPTVTAGGMHGDVNQLDFPEFMAEALLSFMSHKLAASGRQVEIVHGAETQSRPLCFVPLFNFCHKDGVDMVTIGGAITAGEGEDLWRNKVGGDIKRTEDGLFPRHQRLDIAPLTLKEKLTLDACLPHSGEDEFIQQAKNSGLQLQDQELSKYWLYHQYFPVYFETPL